MQGSCSSGTHVLTVVVVRQLLVLAGDSTLELILENINHLKLVHKDVKLFVFFNRYFKRTSPQSLAVIRGRRFDC